MLFTNAEFGIFYVLVFLIYWKLTQGKLQIQNLLILAVSYVFYGWWDYRFLSLIIFSSLIDYTAALRIVAAKTDNGRKAWMWLSIAINLGMLGFFKYYNFFVGSFIDLFAGMGVNLNVRTLNIILPVGISFYTFQTMSYTLDVYRKKMQPSNDLIAFLAYVSFFPQLVAGPIERAIDLLPQFLKERQFDLEKAKDGMRQVLWGFFKKIVIADTLGEVMETITANYTTQPGIVLLMGLWFFSIQLVCDFSGYSDIAIGSARILGFNLSKNFDYPLFSREMLEFWKRWHITLTSWFRDYLYLGLNKWRLPRKKSVIIRNFMITFIVSGLWHGANWTFVVWGLLHGLYQIPFILFSNLRVHPNRYKSPYTFKGTVIASIQMALTLLVNVLTMVFFIAPNLSWAFDYLRRLFSPSLFTFPQIYKWNLLLTFAFMGIEAWAIYKKKVYPLQIGDFPQWLRWVIYYAVALVILYFNYERRSFLYFQF